MRIVLPITLQVILSIILIYKLFKSRINLHMSRSIRKEYIFSFTIMILNIVYLITEMPLMFSTLYFGLIGVTPVIPLDMNMSQSLAIQILVYYCTLVLSLYMFGSIFFVNLMFNKIFKAEIKSLFWGKYSNTQSRQLQDSTL